MKHPARREFLKQSAMIAALLGTPGLLRAGGGTDAWRPRLALSSVMFSDLSLEELCRQAVELGFKGIDLWGPFGDCRHLARARELGVDEFRKLLRAHDLEIGAWTTYRTKGHDEGFPGFAEFIGGCGGGVVVRESKYGSFAADQLDAAMREFFAELRPEIELARKHKVRLAIENHGHALLDSPQSFEAFKRHNPAPDVVGLGVAPYHLQKRKADVSEVIGICGDHLLFFYAWQSAGGTKQLPGHGPADFEPWMRALSAVNYSHWMTPFMHGGLPQDEMAAAVAKAVDYLRNDATPNEP
ncbi:sugar phosphate isomerase/epimerase family protein [Haloferula sp. A504]|uniref:sugar phosphate isomerase/epimerase family protein n=1 Tax=Haloferula sp. A504 TaxID=3373601 RepID=UPI0031BD149F|nr:sugar phosphate isomerase/epimerase [Verrucomicrobiaceae bacterium E54]